MKPQDVIRKLVVLGVSAALIGAALFLALFAWYSRDLPDPNDLLTRDIPQSTKIFDRTGEHLLYEISLDEKRTLVPIEQIPLVVQQATIAAEDHAFYEHHGFSFRGFARALVNYAKSFGQVRQGGSTITQQLVKNAILTNEKRLSRKMKELVLSLALEQNFTKDQILQMYLNEIPYGGVNYGVESASQAYFGKSVKDVSLPEAAVLAALPNRPSALLRDPEELKRRRDWILFEMVELGFITEDEANAAQAIDTPAQVKLGNIIAPHFVLWIKGQLEERYTTREVETGGLKVITTIDIEKQQFAEDAVKQGVETYGANFGFKNAGLLSLDPSNGQILAMVGSPDFHNDEIAGQVNVTLQPLQPGSSIKPIVYAAAFEKGYTPHTILWDVETTFPTATGPYAPKNYDLGERGPVTIRQALQGSLNIPAVKALYLVGVDNAIAFMKRLGYTTIKDSSQVGLAMVLGGAEITLLEHTSAYATMAERGVRHSPVALLKVEDSKGNVLEEWKLEEHKGDQVIAQSVADTLTNVLSDNAARAYVFGGANYLTLPGRPAAGKTGTTNDYKDAWMMGYVPSLAAGVWVGNADGTEMHRGADGSKIAAPIWQNYMSKALQGTPAEAFPGVTIEKTDKPILDGEMPATVVVIDTSSGKLATERTPARFREEKMCGEYHTILRYVNREDPRGPAPERPESDPMHDVWEAAIQAWITKHNAALKEGEKPMQACDAPTEEDDVHTKRNEPEVRFRAPNSGDAVSRTFEVTLDAATRRPFDRVEYTIDDIYVTTSRNMSGATITLPAWVRSGDVNLKATIFDDVDNSASDSVRIHVEGGNQASSRTRIVNPFSGQTIERGMPTYPVALEVPDYEEAQSLTLYVTNRFTGVMTTIGESGDPQPVTSMEWTLPEPGEYLLSATLRKDDGSTEEVAPVSVMVRNSAVSISIPL